MGVLVSNRMSWVLAASFSVCCVVAISASAQVKFEKRLGSWLESGNSVRQTHCGGYAIGGWTNSGAGARRAYLIKTDSLGEVLWDTAFGGAGKDQANSLWQTSDGGYALAGYTDSYGAGGRDLYLIKADSLGCALWEATCGGPHTDEGRSVQETSDGCLVVAGVTFSFGPVDADVYLVKVDSVGNVLWQRTYGGDTSDVGESVQETTDGGYIIAGSTQSFGAGDADVYLVKTDSSGNVLWDTTYGGSGRDGGMSVQQTEDGGYIVAGYTGSFGAGGGDVYLVKTDSLGNTLWDATYGGTGNDVGRSVDRTVGGGYIIAGTTESFGAVSGDIYLVKTDSLGGALWERTFDGRNGTGGQDEGRSVQQTSDGGYIIAGGTGDLIEIDVYLIKTDENGLTGIDEVTSRSEAAASDNHALRNQPNPFQYSTVISYSLASTSEVIIEIHDITGRLVETLLDKRQDPGAHEILWDARSRPLGIYFCRLEAGEFIGSRKMVLAR